MPRQTGRRVVLKACPALDLTIKRLKASGDVATASLLWRLVFSQTTCRVVGESHGMVTLQVRGRRATFAVPMEAVKAKR